MSTPTTSSGDRFQIVCPYCKERLTVRDAWIHRTVQCPHCEDDLQVPVRGADGHLPRGIATPARRTTMTVTFGCPGCKSMLEAGADQAGHSGRCPTCNVDFIVPQVDPRTGRGRRAIAPQLQKDDPTPMHAYAASGHQAPRIRRREDGTPEIECPRCHRRQDVKHNNCAGCGVPFSIEGVGIEGGVPGHTVGIWSLVCGCAALPLFMLALPAVLAVVLGFASWFRSTRAYPPPQAFTGLLLGVISILLLMAQRVF
jgi:DNA-directed RNA polymerase subunit M/transcription elongation factor TFIIS